MRIVIDARMMGPRWTGIGLYTQKLIEQLALIDHDNTYLALVNQENFEQWVPPAANITKILAPYKIYSLAEQTFLPLRLWRLKPDLVHFLHNVPIIYRGRRVVVVHDTTMIDFDLAPRGTLKAIKYKLKRLGMRLAFRASASADMIIAPSNATKQRLLELLKGRTQAKRIEVIYESTDYADSKPRPIDATNPKLLYVGTLYPYKNITVLLKALALLIKNRPELFLKVVGSTPRFNQSVVDQIESLGLKKNVELAGFVSDDEKTQAYRKATLFVFPSLSEGFGLPPLEAMGQGLPVLAAKASALPEILGDGADYFDPYDPADLAEKIEELLVHPERLVKLQQRGFNRLKDFSWAKMAAQTLEVYKSLS